MTKDEALRLALEALDALCINDYSGYELGKRDAHLVDNALTAIKEALAQPEQEPVIVDPATMELAESVGLIGPASRTHDLHNAIQRFHDLICANATIKAAVAFSHTLEAKDEPVAWATREDFYRELEHAMNRMRQQMEIKSVTMRCTDYDLALPVIDIFDGRILVGQVTTPPQRTWVGLTDEEIQECLQGLPTQTIDVYARRIEAKLKQKNGYAEEKNT